MLRKLMTACLVTMFTTSLLSAAAPDPPEGFTALFNGEDLTGWYGLNLHSLKLNPQQLKDLPEEERQEKLAASTEDALNHWSVDNGELVNDGHGAYLTTEKEYGDIELLIEYKTVAKADSGIYLRATPQVQIWDTTEAGGKWDRNADKGSGGLFNNAKGAPGQLPLVHADKPFGEWNKLRIIQVGDKTTVYLNDKLVVDHATMENYWNREIPLYAKGPIQLQTHGGEIRWRKLFVREIPNAEANKILAAGSQYPEPDFMPLFNGKDFTGWKGPIENYQVEDGAIMCQAGKGGTIYHQKDLQDFVVRLEFQLPPGGNNGLAIRYPGSGNPAYAGMTELQVLDSEHPKYAKLDPRQYHGSAYGMAAAKRGYLRPTGEWNYQQVTVKGSTIKVELNGYTILDTDLSTISEYMANSPHPGKDLKHGYFGFAGHNDPVKFRNIRVMTLE